MRSLEYLISLYPDLTGKELLEIQKQDKLEAELEKEKENKANLDIINNIKTNGGFFRGAFSTSQYYMYKILDIELNGNQLVCKCEKIILFDTQNINNGVLSKDTIQFEIEVKDYVKYEDITLLSERIDESEYNSLKTVLFGIVPKFFPKEWDLRQKEFGK